MSGFWGVLGPRRNDHGFGRESVRPGARSSFKVRGVEGWRGVACLVVVGYHVWQNMDLDQNGLGPAYDSPALVASIISLDVIVDLFFVLSGLLLFLPFAQAALDDDRRVPSRREFLWRRCVRLFPVYWLVVLVAWSTRNFGVGTAQWLDLVEHLLLVQSFDSERIFHTLGPAWTLSVEWVFYLLLAAGGPTFVVWVRRRATTDARVVRMLLSLAAVAALSMLYKLNVELVWEIPRDDWAWRFGPAAKADDFAIGMALAVVMVAMGHRRLSVGQSTVAFAIGIWCIYESRIQLDLDPDSLLVVWRHPLASLGWALVLLAVMACESDRPSRWVDNRLAVRLSIVAYTVYLVHEPIILGLRQLGWWTYAPDRLWVNLAVVLPLTLLLGWLSHRLVEEPWTDLAALQRRGGGRRDLYAEVQVSSDAPRVPAPRSGSTPDLTLRDEVLAGRPHRGAVLAVRATPEAER